MSRLNGDKARFQINRKRVVKRRAALRALAAAAAATPASTTAATPSPAPVKTTEADDKG